MGTDDPEMDANGEVAELAELAEAILEGKAIEWDAIESAAGPERQPLLQQLRLLADVAALHRSLPPAGLPRQWAHLKVFERIGHGAFGEVYRAWDSRLDREVALKLLRPADPAASAPGKSVIEEGRLLARVRHPNVITVYGAERIEGEVGLWTELIHGRNVEQWIKEQGPLSAQEAVAVGIDLCRALAAVHGAGLLHRDIKARNVMRETGGRIVLMDFGAGRELAADASADFATGTPLYLAPELFADRAASAQSDIYSLSVLLYFLVTGSYRIQGRSLEEIRAAHLEGRRILLRDARPDLPEAFIDAVEKGLDADPAARYQTPGALEAALRRAQGSGVEDPAAAPRTPMGVNAVWASRYDIQEMLGSGGMGTVYKAYDKVLGEVVALKLLKAELLADATTRERFKSEIRLARKVRHPNVCSIYEFGETDQGPYVSMEFVGGSDLRRVLRERGGLPGRQAFELAIQVAEGLQAVHDAGIVHRDLKTSNLMLDSAGTVRLMDFGIAKREGERTLTTGHAIVGTPEYMSPEQAQGMRVGPTSDIYSLGVVIFELFTGRLPFTSSSALGVALKHQSDEPPLQDPLIPPAAQVVLAQTLAKQPSARYASARAVANALRAAQTEAAAPSASALAGGGTYWPARRTLPLGLAALVLVATAATVLVLKPGWRQGPVPKASASTSGASGEESSRASLLVVVRPWGELFVDGKLVGTTPLDWIDVPAGTHVLRVRHPSQGAWEQSVTLEPAERRKLAVDLARRGASRHE